MKKTDLNWETPILGVIGGMGPMATELFYKMIIEKTPVTCDQEHLDTIILGHASMPDRTAAILSKNPFISKCIKKTPLHSGGVFLIEMENERNVSPVSAHAFNNEKPPCFRRVVGGCRKTIVFRAASRSKPRFRSNSEEKPRPDGHIFSSLV